MLVTNLFFVSMTQNWTAIILSSAAMLLLMLLLNWKENKFLIIVSVCWIGAQMILLSLLFMLFDISEVVEFFGDLRKGNFAKVNL